MIYASWSRGFRSGGFNGRGLTRFSATQPYDPETVDSYEVGVKSEFLDNRVALNVAGYHTKYNDIQQTKTVTLAGGTGNETVVINATSAKIRTMWTARVSKSLTLRGTFGYIDAKFGKFITSLPVGGIAFPVNFDFSDVDLIYAPTDSKHERRIFTADRSRRIGR